MKVKKLIEFLEEVDEDMDLSIIMPDCGGYDTEIIKLEDPVIVVREPDHFDPDRAFFLADKSITEIWKPLEIIS